MIHQELQEKVARLTDEELINDTYQVANKLNTLHLYAFEEIIREILNRWQDDQQNLVLYQKQQIEGQGYKP